MKPPPRFSRRSILRPGQPIAFATGLLLAIGMSVSVVLGNPSAISGNTPGFVAKATDLGSVDPNTVISVTVWLKLHNENQLDQLVAQQHQRGSKQYQNWISQDQFNASFGPTSQELNAVQNYLNAKGLSTVFVAENNMFVKVQGTVANIQKAFNVQIHNYNFSGQTYRSNTADPSVNDASGAHIAAITGMDDYGFQPHVAWPTEGDGSPFPSRPLNTVAPSGLFFEAHAFRGVQTQTFTDKVHTATYTGNRYGADITNNTLGHLPPQGYQPSEVRTAYGLDAVYGAGLDGTGQTIVIVDAFGSSTIAQDAEAFSQIYSLPDLTSSNFQIVKAPGLSNNLNTSHSSKSTQRATWNIETTLDVEWSHAIAPGANIALVVATDKNSLDEAINYAVVHHLGNVISNSWGSPEALPNPATFIRVNRILEMAAAQGIDVNFSTGDSGDFGPALGFTTVSFPASSPFATGVGGTSMALNLNNNNILFQTGWGTNLARIADRASLGSPPVVPPLNSFQYGSGGGASGVFPRPSFQSGLSVSGNTRVLPDISWLADPFTGVELIMTDPTTGQLSVSTIGGTSLACPMFSALMTIASEKAGHGLGQAAQLVYSLPADAITDVTAESSPNNVTGKIDGKPISADALAAPLGNTTSYFSALYNSPFSTRWFVLTFGTDTSLTTGPGWDNVTGLGTPNGLSFINAITQ